MKSSKKKQSAKLQSSPVFGFVLLALAALVGYYLLDKYATFRKNRPEFCQAGSASWQTPEQCVAQQGHYIAGDKVCTDEKWLGPKADPRDICCVSCTDDNIIDNG